MLTQHKLTLLPALTCLLGNEPLRDMKLGTFLLTTLQAVTSLLLLTGQGGQV